jgi:hypothetical protein
VRQRRAGFRSAPDDGCAALRRYPPGSGSCTMSLRMRQGRDGLAIQTGRCPAISNYAREEQSGRARPFRSRRFDGASRRRGAWLFMARMAGRRGERAISCIGCLLAWRPKIRAQVISGPAGLASTTLADLLTPLLAANPFSAMRPCFLRAGGSCSFGIGPPPARTAGSGDMGWCGQSDNDGRTTPASY